MIRQNCICVRKKHITLTVGRNTLLYNLHTIPLYEVGGCTGWQWIHHVSPTIEAQRLGDDIPSHLIHEQEGWQCCCDNTTLVARYEERIAACEVLLQEFHRHLVAQQAESQSLRAELVAQRGWWDKLAQLFAGH